MNVETQIPRKHLRRILAVGSVLGLAMGLTYCTDLPSAPKAAAPPEAEQSLASPLGILAGPICTSEGALLSSGAAYRVCVNPSHWNGHLVVFVPGYHNPASDPAIPRDELRGVSVADIVTGLGFAWATTSFRGTGLVVPESWIDGDLLELVATAKEYVANTTGRSTQHVFQTGGSQGGLITTLAVERYPHIFTGGGLAACGPIGDYRKQIEFVGDFRVVFDYLFQGVIPGWPVWTQSLPPDPADWNSSRQDAVRAALVSHPELTEQLLSVTRAPIDNSSSEARAASIQETAQGLLWYSFAGTNDAITKLGGMPFSNSSYTYSGSANDAALNAGVQRFTFTANPNAIASLQTTGRLRRPLVTMFTTGDEIVPVWHGELYRRKTYRYFTSWLLHNSITVRRYGHCNFTAEEVLGAFAVLVLKTTGQNLVVSTSVMPAAESQTEFLQAARRYGARPRIVDAQ